MIRYSLRCDKDHEFESWFQSATAFDSLIAAGRVNCPVCGSAVVHKSLMAPALRPSRMAEEPAERPRLDAPQSELEAHLAELRRQVEENSDYVGVDFVAEARRMHAGDAPERSIYGEAKPEEAIKLLEEGVPVAPLPFMPARKTN